MTLGGQEVGTLPENERDVITLRFGPGREEPSLRARLGRRLGLSTERVRQLEDQALRRLAKDDRRGAQKRLADYPRSGLADSRPRDLRPAVSTRWRSRAGMPPGRGPPAGGPRRRHR